MNRIDEIIRRFEMQMLAEEGTFLTQTYQSDFAQPGGQPAGTAIIGLYCEEPKSLSCFHRLSFDEVWHFYDGDPFELHLLHDNGSSETVVMGRDWRQGQRLQFVVPAGVWQGGCIVPGGAYSLYGTTMAPGFTPDCFEAGNPDELIQKYPHEEAIIRKLCLLDGISIKL